MKKVDLKEKYSHYLVPNFMGKKIGMDGITTQIFESKRSCTFSEYERNMLHNLVIKPLKRLDGSVDSLIKVLKIFRNYKPLPEDSTVLKEYKDEEGLTRTKTIKHTGNATINRVVANQLSQIEAMIKVRLGRKNEGVII